MTIIGVAIRPKKEIEHKIKILKEYIQDQQIFSKEEAEVLIVDEFDEFDIDDFSKGDTFIFVYLKDLRHLGLYATLSGLLEKGITVHILPYFEE